MIEVWVLLINYCFIGECNVQMTPTTYSSMTDCYFAAENSQVGRDSGEWTPDLGGVETRFWCRPLLVESEKTKRKDK